MSSLLLVAALALAASLPIAALAFAAGSVAERFIGDPVLRERTWTALFLLPAAALVLAITAPAAPATLVQGPGAPAAGPPGSAPMTVLVRTTGMVADPSSPGNLLPAALVASALAGALFRLARSVHGARRLRRWVRNAQSLNRPYVERALAQLVSGPGRAPLLVSDDVDRPLLAGIRRSAVLLPGVLVDRCSPTELAMTCAHELAHQGRRDNLRLVLETTLEGLFWFNPFVRACRASLWAAREEVCDAMVLAGASPRTRRLYAGTLVQALRLSAGPGPQTAFIGARRNTAMRLNAILHPARSASPASKLALLLLGAGLLTPTLVLAAGVVSLQGRVATAEHHSVYSFTSKTDAAPEVAVIVRADEHEERPDGSSVSRGRVEVEARNVPAGMIRVDGKPQPAGVDLSALRGRVERVEATGTTDETPPEFNIVTRPALPAGHPSTDASGRPGAREPLSGTAPARSTTAAPLKPGLMEISARTVDQLSPGNYRYTGEPEIRGTVDPDPAVVVTIDGEPAPVGLDLGTIPREQIARIDLTTSLADGQPLRANTPKGAPRRTLVNISLQPQ